MSPAAPTTSPTETSSPELDDVVETDQPWIVLVWNDPINTMDYVALVFQKLFGYSKAKAEHMAADTVEGAELALATGPALRRMFASGRLDEARMPLTAAIIDAVCDDAPFDPDWTRLHDGAPST